MLCGLFSAKYITLFLPFYKRKIFKSINIFKQYFFYFIVSKFGFNFQTEAILIILTFYCNRVTYFSCYMFYTYVK